MEDQIFIQHRFTITRDGKTFSDALVLPQEEYQSMSPDQIEAEKEKRFQGYVYAITNPVKQPEPTKEEKLSQIQKDLDSLEQSKQLLLIQKSQIENKVVLPEEGSLADKPV